MIIYRKLRKGESQPVTESEIEQILKSLNAKKSVGIDGIPPVVLKLCATVIAKPLAKIVNMSILENTFPSFTKCATILPVHKKDERTNKKNFRPISILSSLSKVFERILHMQLTDYTNNILSIYFSACRKKYNCQHVLMRLIQDWRQDIDKGLFVGAVLMDLSKAFDCIPHDLLIAKLNAY